MQLGTAVAHVGLKHYPARCVADGIADETSYLSHICSEAARTGGAIVLPAGTIRVRRGMPPFVNSGGLAERAVYITGAGWGSTQILWDPEPGNVADDLFAWGDGTTHYNGGGASGFSVRSAQDGVTGRAFYLQRTIFQTFRDIWVRRFYGGTGMHISPPPGQDDHNPQHILLDNVHLQQCKLGLYSRYGADISARDLKLNQNQTAGIIEFGNFHWYGGLLQGVNAGPALYIGRGNFTAHVTIADVHVENNTDVAIECSAAKHVYIRNPNWGHRAGQILVDAKHSSIVHVDGVGAVPGAYLVRGRTGARGHVHDIEPWVHVPVDLDSTCDFVLHPWGPTNNLPTVTGARWLV